MNYREESLKKHAEWRGKIETVVRVPVESREDLSLAYTPGALPSLVWRFMTTSKRVSI